jgi:hypothetical protein
MGPEGSSGINAAPELSRMITRTGSLRERIASATADLNGYTDRLYGSQVKDAPESVPQECGPGAVAELNRELDLVSEAVDMLEESKTALLQRCLV